MSYDRESIIKKSSLTKKDWLDYLNVLKSDYSKISSAFGFTASAYIVCILVLLRDIFESTVKINAIKNNWIYFVLFFTCAMNISVIINRVLGINQGYKFLDKVYNDLDRRALRIPQLVDLFNLIITIIGNGSIVFNMPKSFWNMPFIILLVINIYILIKKIQYLIDIFILKKCPDVEKYDCVSRKIKDFILVCSILLYVICPFVPVIQVFRDNLIFTYPQVFECSMFIFTSFLALNFISIYVYNRYRYEWLIDFEREIYINELNENDIKNRLEIEFFNLPYMSTI